MSCITVTAQQWESLLQFVVVSPIATVVIYSLIRDLDRYEYRVRRFLRRRRIRAIRARRLEA
jgi:hypothetical protein